jgi:hypothetical protein
MEFQRDIAPPPAPKPIEVEQERPRQTRVGGMSFSEALAKVEAHRNKVQATLGIAMVARLLASSDYDVLALIRSPDAMLHELPFIGLAMLSYMIVLWFLAARTRDRWGFGMALGIGVLQATYVIVLMVMQKSWLTPMLAWKPAVVAITHLALAFTAFRAGGSYPALDSKKPWVFGFLTAFIFVVLPWVAVPLADALGLQLG